MKGTRSSSSADVLIGVILIVDANIARLGLTGLCGLCYASSFPRFRLAVDPTCMPSAGLLCFCICDLPLPVRPQSLLDFPKLDHRLKNPPLGLFPLPPVPLSFLAPLNGQGFSSGICNRYLLTLPASLPSSPSQNLVLLLSFGTMQSGTNFRMNPRTPFDAASIAAYSSRRVESDVQYCTVAGGGGGGGLSSASCSLEGNVGNWKNSYGCWCCEYVGDAPGIVCRSCMLGRLLLVLVRTTPELLDALFVLGLVDELCEEAVVFLLCWRAEEVDRRSWELSEKPESCRLIFTASSFGDGSGFVMASIEDGCDCGCGCESGRSSILEFEERWSAWAEWKVAASEVAEMLDMDLLCQLVLSGERC